MKLGNRESYGGVGLVGWRDQGMEIENAEFEE